MINRRAYITESALKPGTAVVQGSADNKVRSPGTTGAGDFIGIYSFGANDKKAAGEEVGIVLHGIAKAVAGGAVAAGKKAILKADSSGSLIVLPATAGSYSVVGTFLESGSANDFVDVLIEHGSITV